MWSYFTKHAFVGEDALTLAFRLPDGPTDQLKRGFFDPTVAKAELITRLVVTASPASVSEEAFQSTYARSAPIDVAPLRNRPGKRAVKNAAATAAMVAAVEEGTISYDAFLGMKAKELEILYPHAKRTVLSGARREALKRLDPSGLRRQSSDAIPTK